MAARLEGLLERHATASLLLFSALYFPAMLLHAHVRPYWLDEFFTVDLALLPSVRRQMEALAAGADLTPPLFHLITRACSRLAGTGPIGMRLPAILGFWAMCLAVFAFVRKRYGVAAGVFAMIVPLLTTYRFYATEARGYGLELGFCGAALLCWQSAQEEGGKRMLCLILLPFFLAAAIFTHLYAVAIAVPLAAAELARAIRRKRLDYPLSIALAAGLASVVFAGRLALAGAKVNVLPETQVLNIWRILYFFDFSLRKFSLPLVVLAIVFVVYGYVIVPERPRPLPAASTPEIVFALAACFAVPFVLIAGSTAAHILFMARYAIVGLIGFGIAAGFFAGHYALRYRGASTVAAVTAFLLFAAVQLETVVHDLNAVPPAGLRIPATIPDPVAKFPIYVQDAYDYIRLAHLHPKGLEPRYVADPAIAVKIRGTSLADRNLLQLDGWAPLHLESYSELKAGPRDLLLIYSPGEFGWLLQKLRSDGGTATAVAHQGEWIWFHVHRGSGQ